MQKSQTLIQLTIKEYQNNLKEMLKSIFIVYRNRDNDGQQWQLKKNEIANNIRVCFDYLIIPPKVLKAILKELHCTEVQYNRIQKELVSELEGVKQLDFEKARDRNKRNVKDINNRLAACII